MKRLLETVGDQKSSIESDLKQAVQTYSKMSKEIDEKNVIITKRDVALSEVMKTQIDLNERLLLARNKIIHLSRYEQHVKQSYEHINRLGTELGLVKATVQEMIHLNTTTQSSITDWRAKMQALHFTEVMQLKGQATMLQVAVKRLESIKHDLEQSDTQSKVDKETIEQRLKYAEQAAASVAIAHSGERLSWKNAMEELKVQHRKEKLHIQLVSQDEQDIMRNRIAQLESEMAKQQEHHERKCQILQEDFLHKAEGLNAALSQSKYESVVEIQNMDKEKTALHDLLAAEKEQCASLSRVNEDVVRQINLLNEKHHRVIAKMRENHMQEKEESNRVHAQLFRQLEDKFSKEKEALSEQLEHIKQEMQNVVNNSQGEIARIMECAASVRQCTKEAKNMLCDLKCLSQQLGDTKSEWDHCKDEVSGKLRNMRQTFIAIVNQEKIDTELANNEALCKLNESCDAKVAAATKAAADAKKMLFQSIREYEMKLEKEIRQLKEEHNLHLSTVANQSKEKCDHLLSQFENLSAEFESVVAMDSEKERKNRQLETKILDLTKLHDYEMLCIQSKHQSERACLMKDIKSKEAQIEEKFAEERTQLQTALDEVSRQLNAAKEQLKQTVLTETQNQEHIKSL